MPEAGNRFAREENRDRLSAVRPLTASKNANLLQRWSYDGAYKITKGLLDALRRHAPPDFAGSDASALDDHSPSGNDCVVAYDNV
jgi:hypothetical protein